MAGKPGRVWAGIRTINNKTTKVILRVSGQPLRVCVCAWGKRSLEYLQVYGANRILIVFASVCAKLSRSCHKSESWTFPTYAVRHSIVSLSDICTSSRFRLFRWQYAATTCNTVMFTGVQFFFSLFVTIIVAIMVTRTLSLSSLVRFSWRKNFRVCPSCRANCFEVRR